MRRFALFAVPFFLLSACAQEKPRPSQSVAARPHAKIPPQDFAPGLAEETPPANEAQLVNDPSAPLNTPLCGTALREAAQTGTGIYSNGLAAGNPCTQNACFQPLTGTFISASGARSVCR
ncbi:hypothetical protein [Kozakia baliensis]|uniref:hypothetical protein n=1 Tax=Kozakia baliensis TaxID=153496 RepID=UPI0004962035|nr:hypothetical protein [Kozakia baliensis]AOX21282.1 hypothetical protein A0U90_07695 [Kozakia baliensis]